MMLPEHQGLGMFNVNVDCLGKKISYMRRNWLCRTSVSNLLMHQTFRVDLGLGGHIFQANYDKFEKLSGDDGWYKHLWHLCWRYRIKLSVHQDNDPGPIRQGDQTIMDAFVESEQFTTNQLQQLLDTSSRCISCPRYWPATASLLLTSHCPIRKE